MHRQTDIARVPMLIATRTRVLPRTRVGWKCLGQPSTSYIALVRDCSAPETNLNDSDWRTIRYCIENLALNLLRTMYVSFLHTISTAIGASS